MEIEIHRYSTKISISGRLKIPSFDPLEIFVLKNHIYKIFDRAKNLFPKIPKPNRFKKCVREWKDISCDVIFKLYSGSVEIRYITLLGSQILFQSRLFPQNFPFEAYLDAPDPILSETGDEYYLELT